MSFAPRAWGYKARLIDDLLNDFGGRPVRVLDLGCGTAEAFVDALRRHTNITYTGVEQRDSSLRRARDTIGDYANVTLLSGFGEDFTGVDYDLVISLSVLEHVKRLDSFLSTSVGFAKDGGRVVHRYDLGHALTPSTPGERLRVAAARSVPAIVPAARFTTYPDKAKIVTRLRALGLEDIEITQSQLPGLKGAVNRLDEATPEHADLMQRILDLEADLWDHVGRFIDGEQRDRLFPTVTISGVRRTRSRTDPGAA